MKAVAIVGFKNSGKSKIVIRLAAALKKKGHSVGIVKHCQDQIDIVDKDKAFCKAAEEVIIVSDKETSIYYKKSSILEDVLTNLSADYVFIEGFKQNKTLPRIVCFKTKKEKKDLSCGLEIAFVRKDSPATNRDIERIVKIIEKKAFKLPNLNCGKCGFTNCFGLAKEIVKGNRSIQDCLTLGSKTKLWIKNNLVALNPFVARIMKNIIFGFLSSLKGIKTKGKVRIEIEQD